MTKEEYKLRMNELARQGKFDEYVNDVSKIKYNRVDDKFNYNPKNIFFKAFSLFIRFIMATLGPLLVFLVYHLKIEGRNNLKGIKKAITVSNHVKILDILFNRTATYFHKQYVTGASFNNRKFFGSLFKAGGLLPFGETFTAQKNMKEFLEEKLTKTNCYVHFYSEQALWKDYEKSRPYKIGAFKYASNLNIPVIPLTICFRKPPKFMFWRKHKFATIFIGTPIYPDMNLPKKQREQELLIKAQKQYDDKIIEFYNYDKDSYTYLNPPKENEKN